MADVLLTVRNLKTSYFTASGEVRAVDDVSFEVNASECLCLVGESGCGKTASALSVLRLIDNPPGRILGGEAIFKGRNLLALPEAELRAVRGNQVAMIFQDPQASLNPVLTVGDQITESILLHKAMSKDQALQNAAELLTSLGVPSAKARLKDFPHQFSGGMQQRVMVAMALACGPELLIADEPTTALDVTIKAQIIEIFQQLKAQRNMSLLFITHDLGVVAEIADRVVVMYGGRVAESGSLTDIFDSPAHPYTSALMACLPDINSDHDRLTPIPGSIPDLIHPPPGCIFAPRCPQVMPKCRERLPAVITLKPGHSAACRLYG
jgi:oligopeptide/dipeptide ABC transporter ATP-binding protein